MDRNSAVIFGTNEKGYIAASVYVFTYVLDIKFTELKYA